MLCFLVIAGGCESCGDGEADVDYGILLAVPSDAGVIVKTNDLSGLCTVLAGDCQIWNQLSALPRFNKAAKAIYTLDTISHNNPAIRSVLQGKSAVVSFHKSASDVNTLIGVELNNNDYKKLMDNIVAYVRRQGLVIKSYKHNRVGIYVVVEQKKDGDKSVFFVSFNHGYFMASVSRLTLEQAVRDLGSRIKEDDEDKSLKRLLVSAGKNVSAVMIFNHKQLCEMLAGEISQNVSRAVSRHANWSVLDISINKQVASCAGYTDCNMASHELSSLQSQQPVSNNCHEYLPSKTTSFVSLGISDMHLFANDYRKHLQADNKTADFDANNNRIRKDYGVNFSNLLYTNITNRITEFSCTYSLAGRDNDHYIVAELHDGDNFERDIAPMCRKYREKDKIADKDGVVQISTSKGNKYKVYKFPVKHTFDSYFGSFFSTKTEYLLVYNDLAVFGASVNSLYEYANSIDNGKTLAKNSIYENFTEYVNGKSNLYCYIDIAYSQNDICNSLSKAYADEIRDNFAKLRYIRSLAVQYSHYDQKQSDIFYTNAALMYSTATEAERYVSWIAKTDTTIRGKPQIVAMHNTSDKDIIVQDETCKLYLFDKDGRRVFAKLVGEPLASQIYQIDLYGNGKKQYVFATEHFLHALDRNGNYLDNFPVQLPAMVSTEISVLDYDGTRDYRIFVPCSDRCLYVYTKEGVPLDSWTPLRTNDALVSPVQHFRIDDNDLLVFADNLKTYVVNRRGEVRINVTNSFTKSRNSLFYLESGDGMETRFVTTNSAGEVKYIYTDGSCKSKTFKNLSANHHFVLRDIDGDGSNEYIFTDQDMLYVYNSDGSVKFSRNFEGTIGRPGIFKFSSNDVRIGVASRSLGQLYMFDNKGNLCSGFPLQGTSDFSIAKLSKNYTYSLLTGNSDNYLYNYTIDGQ